MELCFHEHIESQRFYLLHHDRRSHLVQGYHLYRQLILLRFLLLRAQHLPILLLHLCRMSNQHDEVLLNRNISILKFYIFTNKSDFVFLERLRTLLTSAVHSVISEAGLSNFKWSQTIWLCFVLEEIMEPHIKYLHRELR